LLLCSASVKASCEYQINQVGNFFFSASITVTNDGPVDITDFNVSFSFTDATTPNNVFSSGDYIETLSGSGPFTITAIAGNSGVLAANGGSLVLTIQGPGISNGGGLAVLDGSITGDLCGPSLPNEGLTIEKIIVSDDGGSASLDDFDISVNGVEVLWPTPASTSSDSVVVSSISGTYTLSEIDLSDYMEGTWACSDDSDGSFVPVTNGGTFSGSTVVVSAGQSVTCSITNDDDAVVVILPTEIIPSVCSIEPSTNRFQQAAQWLSSGGGTVGTLTATGSSVFASASPFVPGPGVSIDTSNTTTVITGATEANFTDAYLAGDFIDYTVETLTSLSNTSVVSGLVEFGGRDGTAPYQLDVLVSDDNFSTAVRLVSNHIVDTPGSFDFIADDLEQIYLSASTEYIFRIVFYDANPSTSNILMDDFAISVDNCTDHGDAAFITGSNDGGHFLPAVRTHFIGNVSPDAEFGVPVDDNLGGEITLDYSMLG